VRRLERTVPPAAATCVPADLAAGLVVALAFPERLARQRAGGSATYLMAGGTGAELAPGTALTGADWLAVAVADRPPGRRDARVRLAVAVDEASRAGGRRHAAAVRDGGGLAGR
jgi:ATP-dependent helicase HrpB